MAYTKRIRAAFYQAPTGTMPVRAWLLELEKDDRCRIGEDIATVEFGWPVGMPACRPLGQGLWEVRSNLADGRAARVLFGITGEEMVLLHAFIKKTRKIPIHDLALARKRLREIEP